MHARFRPALFVAILLLCGAGCVAAPAAPAINGNAPVAAPASAPVRPAARIVHDRARAWHEVAPGVESAALIEPQTDTAIHLFRFDAARFDVRLRSDVAAPKTVSAWAKAVGGDALAVNGTYFNEDYSPSGFVAVDGSRVGTRSFDLDKTGLLIFGDHLQIMDTKKTPPTLDAAALVNAAQSYPFLLIDGQKAVHRDSGRVSRRAFIGQDKAGRVYAGVVSDGLVSLYATMQALAAGGEEDGIAWQHVLNLDGGPSAGLVARFGGYTETYDSLDAVPNAIIITPRPPATR